MRWSISHGELLICNTTSLLSARLSFRYLQQPGFSINGFSTSAALYSDSSSCNNILHPPWSQQPGGAIVIPRSQRTTQDAVRRSERQTVHPHDTRHILIFICTRIPVGHISLFTFTPSPLHTSWFAVSINANFSLRWAFAVFDTPILGWNDTIISIITNRQTNRRDFLLRKSTLICILLS